MGFYIVEDVIEFYPIKGFEDYYSISKCGKVKSHYKTKKILSPKIDKDGYESVRLYVNPNAYHLRVHRLVAINFIDNPNNMPVVNHLDSDRRNNHYTNLEWTDPFGNLVHGLSKADGKTLAHLTYDDYLRILDMYNKGLSYSEIKQDMGLTCSQCKIGELLSGRSMSKMTGITTDMRNRTLKASNKFTERTAHDCLRLYYTYGLAIPEIAKATEYTYEQIRRLIRRDRNHDWFDSFFCSAHP